jgi:hypothetical protein
MTTQNNFMFVKKMRLLCFVSISCLLAACQSSHIRSINLGNGVTAEGRIGPDTVYDGPIKFYDAKANRLIEEGNYVNGIKSGTDIIYNRNGTIASKAGFADGKQNGYSFLFDTSGNLVQKTYSYYGLNVGASVNYSNDSVKEFYFYGLDENVLMYLNYDSIKGKKLGEIQSKLFFFHDTYYQPYHNQGTYQDLKSFFVYTPNPPKFDFKYSFVLVDSAFKVLSVLNQISNSQPWSIINIDWKSDHPNQKLALRLKIRDSINNKDITGFKVLGN